jgi:dUTPase
LASPLPFLFINFQELQPMTKLLISLPLSDAAQRFYGSTAPTYNKVGDAGIDLPFVNDVKPYDAEVVETIGVISFETVFAMYDLNCRGRYSSLEHLMQDFGFGYKDILSSLSTIAHYYLPSHFDIRPRSSIGKTPFRLANAVGTIDETYQGIEQDYYIDKYPDEYRWTGDTLGCYLDYHPQLGKSPRKPYISAGDRLLQVVAPNLDSILHIKLDFTEENCQFWSEVIGNKQRSGFGSTNANG